MSVHVFPIRHHSPRSSAALAAFLDRLNPDTVLIEGPADATPLVEALVDPETKPPVAILGYDTEGRSRSALWPLASFSPEYVAARWAKDHYARIELIDLPVGHWLALTETKPSETPSVMEACARARGFRSLDEFWESSFEAPSFESEDLSNVLRSWSELARSESEESPFQRAREAFMRRRANEFATTERTVAVVVGAAHAPHIMEPQEDSAELDLPTSVPCRTTIIPISYARLAEQVGNRGPRFFQRAHEANCDFERASLETLIDLGDELRRRGAQASLADTLEAYRLTRTLASLRGKSAPGLDDLRDAAIAAIARGDAGAVDPALQAVVASREAGRVAKGIGTNSLQEEFRRAIHTRKLPETERLEPFSLTLNNEVEVGTSVFLHRLRLATVPYARYGATEGETVGGLSALTRVREAWFAQWTPAVEAALVDRIVLGSSLEAVAERLLADQLSAARTAADVASILLEAVVVSCPGAVAKALSECDARAAIDEDLLSLAQACRSLAGLVSFGTSRRGLAVGSDALEALFQKTFARAVLRARPACSANDAAVGPLLPALRTLHDLALSQAAADRERWFELLRDFARSYEVNAIAAGYAAGLRHLAQDATDEEIAAILAQRVSNAHEPRAVASFLGGFVKVQAAALVRNDTIVRTLDDWLTGLDAAGFRDVLPVLRRALATLSPTDRQTLIATVLRVRGIVVKAKEMVPLDETERQRLMSVGEVLGKVLDDLERLL